MVGPVQGKANPAVKHPAVFSDPILERLKPLLADSFNILDPFAGVGKLATIIEPHQKFIGFEIEKEWADQCQYVTHGNAFQLMPSYRRYFDTICVSCAYGNRMADKHEANDGSHRRTYRHYLGKQLHNANSGGLQWGPKYRLFHVAAWRLAWECLAGGGRFILNIKNHIRGGQEQMVSEWHASVLQSQPYSVWLSWLTVPVHGYRYGDNRQRIPYESILVFRKGAVPL